MIYNLLSVISDIKIAMDENHDSSPLEGFSDFVTLTNNEIIKSKLLDACRIIESECDLSELEQGVQLNEPGVVDVNGVGHVPIPNNFMRLLYFKAVDWKRPVFTAIEPGSPLLPIQYSQWKGIRGNPENPVVVLTRSSISSVGSYLEYYSTLWESASYICWYLPLPTIVMNATDRTKDYIDIPQKLYRAVILKTADLVLIELGKKTQIEQ